MAKSSESKEILGLRLRFEALLQEARLLRRSRRQRQSDIEYALLLNLMERIVALRQERAEQVGLGDLQYEFMADHAEAMVRGVREGYIQLPKPTRVSPKLLIGTCYPGESTQYYRDFTPKDAIEVELEFKKFLMNGYTIPAIWVFPRRVGGLETYYVIDGHGRSSLANCIGNPIYTRIFR